MKTNIHLLFASFVFIKCNGNNGGFQIIHVLNGLTLLGGHCFQSLANQELLQKQKYGLGKIQSAAAWVKLVYVWIVYILIQIVHFDDSNQMDHLKQGPIDGP